VGEDTRAERLALAALVAGGVGIAFAPIFVRWSEVGPSATAFWRLALAAPAMWLLAWRQGGARPAGRREVMRLVLPGLFFAADLGVWHWSIRFTTVANSTLLANLAPVFVTLGGFFVLGRGFGRLFLAGLGVAIAGAILLTAESLRLTPGNALGDGLGVLTAVFYAAYILAVSRARERYSTATVLAWSATAAAVILLPVSVVSGERLLPATGPGWLNLLGLAFVSHVGGQGLIAYALRHLPANFSSVTLLIQPLGAALLAWVFFQERFGRLQALGGGVIVAGILLARRGSRAPPSAAPVPHSARAK
jgi:drug/metabolite transporter (DMT)-like permease